MIKQNRFLEYIGYGGRTAAKHGRDRQHSIGTGTPVSKGALFGRNNYGSTIAQSYIRRTEGEYPTSPRT